MGASMDWYETSNALVPSQDDLGWLISRGRGDLPYFTGSDASGWEDSVWILNSFYELPVEGALPTYGEIHKSRIAAGGEEPLILSGSSLGDITPGTSMGLGYVRRPSADWRRRTWSEMHAFIKMCVGICAVPRGVQAAPPVPARSRGCRFNEVTPKLGFGVLDVLASDARSLRCP